MTINEIIDYVTHSPENTNPNVLRSMLGDISSGGQSSDLTCIPLEFTQTETETKLNKTWNEIYEAPETTIYYVFMDNIVFIAFAFEQNETYLVQFLAPKAVLASEGIEPFTAQSINDYPTYPFSKLNPSEDPSPTNPIPAPPEA